MGEREQKVGEGEKKVGEGTESHENSFYNPI